MDQQRVLHVGRVAQVNAAKSSSPAVNDSGRTTAVTITPTAAAPVTTAIPSTVQYQIVTTNDLANRSGCQFPVFVKQSNPPPPQLIATSSTPQHATLIMDNNKQNLNEVRVVPQGTVVLTTSAGSNNTATIQSSQIFATHNGQVLLPGTTIINTPVAVAGSPNVVKIDTKQRPQQQQMAKKVVSIVPASQIPHLQQKTHLQQPQIVITPLQPSVDNKVMEGQQAKITSRSDSKIPVSSACSTMVVVNKPRKSYSATKGKTKRDDTVTVATIKNANLQSIEQLQQRGAAISISPIQRVTTANTTGVCHSTNTVQTGTSPGDKKLKEISQRKSQNFVEIQTSSQVNPSNCQQLLIVMENGREGKWMPVDGKTLPGNITDLLKKQGVPEAKLEVCTSAILEADNSSNKNSSGSNSSNNNNSNNNNNNRLRETSSEGNGNSGICDNRGEEQQSKTTDHIETLVYQEGKLAVCTYCGFSSPTFNKCLRCTKPLPPDAKSIPIRSDGRQLNSRVYVRKSSTESATAVTGASPECPKKKAKLQEKKKVKTKVEEPVCLTISSDEESLDQENLPNKSGTSKSDENSSDDRYSFNCDPAVTQAAMEKEPVIDGDDNEQMETDIDDANDNNNSAMTDSTAIALQQMLQHQSTESGNEEIPPLPRDIQEPILCRTVRIGSYKTVPSTRIFFNLKSIDITVPSINDCKADVHVQLNIPFSQIVKVLAHYGRAMPVFFIYTTPAMGNRVRELLQMSSKEGYYYDPTSKVETQRRITLLPEKLSDEGRNTIKAILNMFSTHEELNSKEANDILVRASPKEVQNLIKKNASPAAPPLLIQTIMVYPPPPSKGGIPINTEDYGCLGEDQFLNDVIIDFYLKYLTQTMLDKETQARTYVLSSFFYKRLTTKPAGTRRSHNPTEDDPDVSPAEKRHSRVRSWTKAVDIFAKDFIIIPINENCHWFLAIICFPGLTGPVRFSDDTPISIATPKPKKKPPSLIDGCSDKELADNVMAGKTSLMIGSTTITAVNTTIAIATAPTNPTITLEPEEEDRDEADGEDEDWGDESSEDDQESGDGTNKLKDNQQLSQLKESNEDPENNDNKQAEERLKQATYSVQSPPPLQPLQLTEPVTSGSPKVSKPTTGSRSLPREPIKQPCILIFDSLAGASRARVVATLRDYLRIEYKMKHGVERDFSKNVMKGACPKVPQQTNYTDCGLYVLQYVEAFFEDPITDYHIPIKMLQDWFTPALVSRKRYDIQQLLHRLMAEQNVDFSAINLPELNLRPYGNLVSYSDSDDEHHYAESMDDEMDGGRERDEEDEDDEGEFGNYETEEHEGMVTEGDEEEEHEGMDEDEDDEDDQMEDDEEMDEKRRAIVDRMCDFASRDYFHPNVELVQENTPKTIMKNLKSYRIPRLVRNNSDNKSQDENIQRITAIMRQSD